MKRIIWLLASVLASASVAGEPLSDQLAAATKDGDASAQIEILTRMLDQNPADDEKRTELVELWLQSGDVEMAAQSMKAGSSVSEDLAARVAAQTFIVRDQDLPAAISTLEAVKKPSAATLNDLQSLLGRQGDWTAQARVLTTLLAIQKSAPLLVARAEALRRGGEFSRAIQDVRAASAMVPDDPSVRAARPSFERLERSMATIAKASTTLKKSPTNLGALLRRAAAYSAAGLPALAFADAKAALTVMPDSLSAAIISAYNSPDQPTLPISTYLPQPSDEALAGLITWDESVAALTEKARLNRLVFVNQQIGQPALAWHEAADVLSREPRSSRAALEGLLAAAALNEQRKTGAAWAKLRSLDPSTEEKAAATEAMAAMFFRLSDFSNAAKFAAMSVQTKPSDSASRILADAEGRLAR